MTAAQNAGIAAAGAAGFCARTRPPGTEFLDAETGPQISPPKWVSAHRDKNPGNEWSEIPAETPYLVSSQNRAVCGDRMVADAVARNSSPKAKNKGIRERAKRKKGRKK